MPLTYLDTASQYFDPLAERLAGQSREQSQTLVVGINGSQGSGKSTLCDYLCQALQAKHGLTATALSLDDFYLTRAQRQDLARQVHPLLATRGVPGTQDIALLRRTLRALQGDAASVAVPRFDKAEDDRFAREQWARVPSPVDIILLEGWCLGARSVGRAELASHCNALERDEDSQGRWRGYVNQALAQEHEALYTDIDFWVMLKAPDFEHVLRWRTEQEDKLRAARGAGAGLMNQQQLERFIAHFERHTRSCLEQLPGRVDVLFSLDPERRIESVRGLGGSAQ